MYRGGDRKDPRLPSAILRECDRGQKANSIKRNEPITPGAKALMFKKLGALSLTEYLADNISNNPIVLQFSNLVRSFIWSAPLLSNLMKLPTKLENFRHSVVSFSRTVSFST